MKSKLLAGYSGDIGILIHLTVWELHSCFSPTLIFQQKTNMKVVAPTNMKACLSRNLPCVCLGTRSLLNSCLTLAYNLSSSYLWVISYGLSSSETWVPLKASPCQWDSRWDPDSPILAPQCTTQDLNNTLAHCSDPSCTLRTLKSSLVFKRLKPFWSIGWSSIVVQFSNYSTKPGPEFKQYFENWIKGDAIF